MRPPIHPSTHPCTHPSTHHGRSLTGALFVAEVAFPTDEEIKGHSKIGALLSALVGFLCWGVSQFQNFKEEDVVDQAHQQVEEEVMDESRSRRRSISGDSADSRDNSRDNSNDGSSDGDSSVRAACP